jgi:endonuclease/exonuclease/phosphatase family metal-dependent hydrolase
VTAAIDNPRGPSVTIFCLNLRFGLADDGPDSWEQRRKLFPRLLENWQADFYTFQEVNTFQVETIGDMLEGYQRIGQRSPAPAFWQNNIIFAHPRWQCLQADHFYLSPTPEIPSRYRNSRWPRQCTMGLFQNEGQQLICVNTHFDFAADVQTQSAELIMRRLEAFAPRLPALLVGDFNASPQAPCRKVFTRRMDSEHQDGDPAPPFQDAFADSQSGTHHGFSGQSDSERIDWILFRPPLAMIRSVVIEEHENGSYPSDHFPLWAQFKWKTR